LLEDHIGDIRLDHEMEMNKMIDIISMMRKEMGVDEPPADSPVSPLRKYRVTPTS